MRISAITADAKILEALQDSAKPRKKLLEDTKLPETTLDTALLRLRLSGQISYEIRDTRNYRPSGKEYLCRHPNPKVRFYFLKS